MRNCLVFLLLLLACRTLSAQTKKQLEWMKNHPDAPQTKQWVKNNPDHPALKKWKARHAAKTGSESPKEPEPAPPKEYRWKLGVERSWKDASGSFTILATLVDHVGENVLLEKSEDHAVIEVPLDKLSAEDQKYVASWESMSDPTRITVLDREYKRRCRAKLLALEKRAKDLEAASALEVPNKYQSESVRQLMIAFLKEVEADLKDGLDNAGPADRKLYEKELAEVKEDIKRWESGEFTKRDFNRDIQVDRLIRDERERIGKEIARVQQELDQSLRRATVLVKGQDAPYTEVDGRLLTEAELKEDERKRAQIAANKEYEEWCRKTLVTPRTTGDYYVQALLDKGLIKSAAYLTEGETQIDPRWGDRWSGLGLYSVYYTVQYVSDAGLMIEKQTQVIVQRTTAGYWTVHAGFPFVQRLPTWVPSDADIGRAFGR